MNKNIAEAIDKFMEKIGWGVIFTELLNYLKEEAGLEISYRGDTHELMRRYSREKYDRTVEWKVLMASLLKESFIGASGESGRKIKSARITPKTQIMAKNNACAYARLFFEIEEDIKRLIKERHLSRYCGYLILKAMYLKRTPLESNEIKKEMGWGGRGGVHYEIASRLGKLKENRFILEAENKYLLQPEIREAFELSFDKNFRKKVLSWKYRENWILPWRKT